MPAKKISFGNLLAKARAIGGVLGGLAWKLALLLLLLYGIAQATVRTEWFRSRVEQELSRLTGMEMRVGRIRSTENLNFKIRDVISVSEEAGIELRQVRVRWRIFRPRGAPMIESIRVDGWAMTFAPDAEGTMQPEALSRVPTQAFGWAGIEIPGREPDDPPETAPARGGLAELAQAATGGGIPKLEMRWGTLRLQDAEGNLQVAISGLDILLNSMILPDGDRITHYDIRAGSLQVARGPRIVGLHVELIDTGDRQFLAVLDATDWGTATRPRSTADEYRDLFDAMDRDSP